MYELVMSVASGHHDFTEKAELCSTRRSTAADPGTLTPRGRPGGFPFAGDQQWHA
jgi:hypothetical protein